MSYNIQVGGDGRLDAIEKVIRGIRPDVAGIIEASSRGNTVHLADRLGLEVAFGEARSGHHLAWLSRRPILRVVNHDLPRISKTLLEIEIEIGDGASVHLFAAHLASSHEEAQFPRVGEIRSILGVLATLGKRPHALVGDFNALTAEDGVGQPPPDVVPKGEAMPGAAREALQLVLDSGYVDCFRQLHRCAGYTYPAHAPWLRLDYVFASPTLAGSLMSCEVVISAGAAQASDHLAIAAEFAST